MQRNMLHSPKVRLVKLTSRTKTGEALAGIDDKQKSATILQVGSLVLPSEMPRTQKVEITTPPPEECKQTSQKPMGWLDSLKATVVHIAEDTVEGASHLAQQASNAATKSASSLPGRRSKALVRL